MTKGNLFVISGPSGAGKGTLVEQVLKRIPDTWVSVSATTRLPRANDIDGQTYLFVSDKEFDTLIEEDGLLEWAEVFETGRRYGTPSAPVLQKIAEGKQVILEIDVQGALQVRAKMPEAHLVFIEPPSMQVLEHRLRERGTETEEQICERLRTAEVELSYKMEYDKQLVNDVLEHAADELVAYMEQAAE